MHYLENPEDSSGDPSPMVRDPMVQDLMTRPLQQGAAPPALAGPEDDDGNKGRPGAPGTGTGLLTKPEPKTKKPSMYKVLMLNDDYTPMEFVVHVLRSFFRMSTEQATRVMLHVHQKGVGVCGVFTYEIAETKVNQVVDYARKHSHPLQCTLEKD